MKKYQHLKLFLLAAILSFTGCINVEKNENLTSDTSDLVIISDNVEEEVTEPLEGIINSYFSYYEDYQVEYPYSKYLTTDEDLYILNETIDSYQECEYTFDGDMNSLIAQIITNTDEYVKEHPEYINALDSSSVLKSDKLLQDNYYYFNINSACFVCCDTLKDYIEKLLNSDLSNNNDDLCKMQNLKIVFDVQTIPDLEESDNLILGEYLADTDIIILYINSWLITHNDENQKFMYDIKNDNIDFSVFLKHKNVLRHELNHMRQHICEDRIDNGQLNYDISYNGNIINALLESSAESALYGEYSTESEYQYSFSYTEHNYDYTYIDYRNFEAELLMITLTDNTATIDDYYNAVFNSDIDGLFKYFNLENKNDIKAFINILKSYDGLEGRNSLGFDIKNITDKEHLLTRGELKREIGFNYKIDILKLCLKNLIDYNINYDDLSIEENLVLKNIICYSLCKDSYLFYNDSSEENLSHYYEESFKKQFEDLDNKFMEFLKIKYEVNNEQLDELNYNLQFSIYEMCNVINGNDCYNENSVGKTLQEKFPKLRQIIFSLGYISDSNYFECFPNKVLK